MLECTVSELSDHIANVVDAKMPKDIKVTGELSSIKYSGKHVYTTIKDSKSSISCIFWNCLKFLHKDGDKVIVSGKITYYSKSGNINFIGSKIESIGVGELYKKYQDNYEKFKTLGYFDNKLDLPHTINTIGILTAKDGAALQDVLYVLNNNKFDGTVYVYNCIVQGDKCPNSIVNGIQYFSKHYKKLDVLLFTRGGGSMEDLMGFSDESVVEAINKCKVYTISAIGHEVDNMLSDFVADYRAPTPSVAGKVICEQTRERLNFMLDMETYLSAHAESDKHYINVSMHKLFRLQDKLPDAEESIEWELENLKSIDEYYKNIINADINKYTDKLNKLRTKLTDNSHENILEKGYILLVNSKNKIINTETMLRKSKKLKLYLAGKELDITLTINSD